jgi:hypothetical protein
LNARRAIPLLVIVLAVGIAFSEVLGPERGLYFRDHELVFRPLWWSVWTQVRSGEWPSLNLAHPSGMPIETSVNAALYTPLTILLFLGDFDFTYDLFVAFHFVSTAIGAHLAARRFGAEPRVAAVVALVWALSGPVFSFENLVVGLVSVSWLPWFAWACHRALSRPSPGEAGLLAAVLAFQLQGMMPEIVLFDALIVIGLWLSIRPEIGPRLFLVLGAAVILSFGLAAVDLGPLWEGFAGTRRAAGFAYEERAGWAFRPLQIVELVAPSFWSPPDLLFFNVPEATGSIQDPPYLLSLYFGAAVPLALAAPLRTDRRVHWVVAATIFFFLVAAGPLTPLHRVLTSLPLLRSGRYAVKYMLFVAAGVSILAGITVSRFEQNARKLAFISGAVAFVSLAAFIVLGMPEIRELLARHARPFKSGLPFELFAQTDISTLALSEMRARLAHGLASSSALLGLVLVARRGWLNETGARLAVSALVALDLSLAAAHALPSAKIATTRLPGEVSEKIGGRRQRVLASDAPPVPTLGGTPFEDYVAHRARHGFGTFDQIRRFESLDVDGQAPAVWDGVVAKSRALPWSELRAVLARAGVGHYLFGKRTDDPLTLEYRDLGGEPIYVHELSGSRPYVFASGAWRTVAEEALVASLADASLDSTTIVVGSGSGLAETSTRTDCRAEVRIDEQKTSFGRIRATVDADCAVVAVVQEIARARWSVTVDGEKVEARVADAGFIAAAVPAGTHSFEARYVPATREWLWVSIVACAMTAALFLWEALRTRRARS